MGRKRKNHSISIALSRSGFLLLMVVTAMLLASMNYGSNMAYILCFLVFGMLLISYLHTRRNLLGLDCLDVLPHKAFAGENVRFTLKLENPFPGLRVGIFLEVPMSQSIAELAGPYTIPPFSATTAEVLLPANRRGQFKLSYISLVTVFPMGLFISKARIKINKEYLVFPRPEGNKTFPPPESIPGEYIEGSHARGGDDFVGTKPWRPGESQHHIDWKAVARGRPLSIKEFSGGGAFQLWFDWNQLSGWGTEQRLSQMTRWVLEADQSGLEFGVRLPGVAVKVGSGSSHTLKCLNNLAIFKFHP